MQRAPLRKARQLLLASTVAFAVLALFTSGAPVLAQARASSQVQVWLTDLATTSRLTPQPGLSFQRAGAASASTVAIDDRRTYQAMIGFGASLTDSSATLLADSLDASQRATLMKELFDPQDGIGLDMLRQPMGASDFALANYSYDDTAPDLADFSIAHDREAVLPVLKEILALHPDLLLFATPWSPPGWMKTSGQMVGGTLLPARRDALAGYFVKFIEAYAAEGVKIDFVTPQNEPHFSPAGYPGMHMEWDEQAAFIKDNLGPALAAAGLAGSTRILVWDHNWNDAYYATNVLADAAARAFVAGSAFHCYEGDVSAQTPVHDQHPELGLWMTECSDGEWNGGYDGRLAHGIELVIGATRNWAKGVLMWNLALDENFGPHTGGCGNCRGVVTISSTGAITHNVEYYALGHASRFVRAGAHRVASTSGIEGVESVAFKNADDGSKVLVVVNTAAVDRTVVVRWNGQMAQYVLVAGAVATFHWT